MQLIKIEMIHDVVCSWCLIGTHNLQQALAAYADMVLAEWHYLPFELNPELSEKVGIHEHLQERNGWTPEQALAYRRSLLQTIDALGVRIDFSKRTHYYNTHDAHRLILASQQSGMQQPMHQALLRAYHEQGVDISDRSQLRRVAASIGVEDALFQHAMASDEITRYMEALQQRVSAMEIRSVPAFIFNDHLFVSGSQSREFFEQLIRRELIH
ncbi:MAG: DsbA family oxidoreductase [Ketobacter sp.]|nr:MAG: DsbA family oxidoreductase [Ketobacter sp.]